MSVFNPQAHITQINTKQGKRDYLPVAYRIQWLRTDHPDATITTEEVQVDIDRECTCESSQWDNGKKTTFTRQGKGYARYRAVVTIPNGGSATGTKTETAASFADYCEKAETGAIGRALAVLGYGTNAVGDELDEGDRLADSPIERPVPQQRSHVRELPPRPQIANVG